ncbi:MAG: PLP-dependent aminotransferase family protein [Chromatiales bacterium]|nr:PLP-dependent aminotransferase family protein [Chromatiales bacterium]
MGASEQHFLYQQVAEDMRRAIGMGTYPAGERLPSLRRIADHYEVSLATAIQAYQWLEDSGFIEARPKSGYYVLAQGCGEACEPEISTPRMKAGEVTVGQLALDILAEARRPDIINLGAAIPGPDLLPLKSLSRIYAGVVRRDVRLLGYYEEQQGNAFLRQQIARRLRVSGVRVHPDEIIITNGCMEALTLSLRTLCKAGDTVAVESPSYYGMMQVAEQLGLNVLELPTHPRDGVDLDALQQALDKNLINVCLFMPSFNNPLGSCMPETNRKKMVAMLQRAGVPLIEDDIYGDLGYDSVRLPAAKAFDKKGEVLLCSSFSKTLAPGYRIGYVVPGRYFDEVLRRKFLGNIATAATPQVAIAEFLQKGSYERVVRKATRYYQQRTERLRQLVLQHFPEGTRVTQPQGGFVLWVELPEHINGVALHDAALRKNITVTPGVIFSPRGDYRHHIRMSASMVGLDVMTDAVNVLGRIAHKV